MGCCAGWDAWRFRARNGLQRPLSSARNRQASHPAQQPIAYYNDRHRLPIKEMVMSALAGKFLIARSALRDAFFGRSVILMLQHNSEGAFGLVLNRPVQSKELP